MDVDSIHHLSDEMSDLSSIYLSDSHLSQTSQPQNIERLTTATSRLISRIPSLRSTESRAISVVQTLKDVVDQVRTDNILTNTEEDELKKTALGRQMTNLDLDAAIRIATRETQRQRQNDSKERDDDSSELDVTVDPRDEADELDILQKETLSKVDSPYSWVVCLGQLCILIATWGSSSGYGVFLSYYLRHDYFPGASDVDYALVGSLVICIAQVLAPFALLIKAVVGLKPVMIIGAVMLSGGFIICSFATQIWNLYVFQGLLGGCGFALTFQPSMPILSTWFDIHRGVASGIVTGGAGAGGVMFSLTAQKVIDATGGFKWALRMVGIVSFAFNFIGFITVKERLKSERLRTWKEVKERLFLTLDVRIIKKWYVACISAWFAFMIISYVLSLYSLSAYCTFIGLSQKQGSNITAIYNGAQAIGRPLLGISGDRIGRINLSLMASVVVMILIFAMWTNCHSYTAIIFFAILNGCTSGIASVMAAPLLSDALPPREFFTSWAYANIIVGLVCLIPEVAALKLRQPEASNPFLHAQIFSGMMIVGGIIVLFPVREWKIKNIICKRLAEVEMAIEKFDEQGDISSEHLNEIEKLFKRRNNYTFLLTTGWKGYFRRLLYPIKA